MQSPYDREFEMTRYLAATVLSLLVFAAGAAAAGSSRQTVTFASLDGLEITADLYAPHPDKTTPFIVLFHQAGWSRGEYEEIAPWLNGLGFNCLAIDQRSGHEVNDVPNLTARRAEKAGKGTTYLDARKDMVAALKYARAHLARGRVIAWGSSYSAGLVLEIAGSQPGLMDGVLAFSPGEYFARFGRNGDWVARSARKITVPVFITSARSERDNWQPIYDAIKGPKASYVPNTKGNHGSRALWKKFDDSQGYRQAVSHFLQRFLTPDKER